MRTLTWVEELSGAFRVLPFPDRGVTLTLRHSMGLTGSAIGGRVSIPSLALEAEVAGATCREPGGLRYALKFESDGELWSFTGTKRGFLRDPYAAFTTLRGGLSRGAEPVAELLLRVDVRGGRLRGLLQSVRFATPGPSAP